jgi:hypothetical protein
MLLKLRHAAANNPVYFINIQRNCTITGKHKFKVSCDMNFDAFRAVSIHTEVSWDATPCNVACG